MIKNSSSSQDHFMEKTKEEEEKEKEKEREKEKEKEEQKLDLSGEKKILLFTNLSIVFVSYLIFSAALPFLATEMTDCGLDSFFIGLVTASYPLGMFISSLLTGYILPLFGAKKVLLFGLGTAITSTIFFGLVPKFSCHKKHDFLAISLFIFLRFIEGFSGGCTDTSVMYSISSVFEKNLGQVLAYQEFTIGVSAMIGPVIGGILYQLIGFFYTFLVFAAIDAMLLILVSIYFPSSIVDVSKGEEEKLLKNHLINVSESEIEEIDESKVNKKFKIDISFSEISSVPLFCSYSIIFMYNFGFTLMIPFLPLYLDDSFGWGSLLTGLAIAVCAFSYGLSAFGVGSGMDSMQIKKTGYYKICMGFGMAIQAAGYWFLGPLPFKSSFINPSSFMTGMVIIGISSSFVAIPTLPDAQHCAKITRDDSPEVKSLVSGVWQAVYSLSSVIGGLCGGFFYGQFGFIHVSFGIFVLFTITAVSITSYGIYSLHSGSRY